jgi:hypothetical protein
MTPDRRGPYGLLDDEQVPLEWRENDQLEIGINNRGALFVRAIAEPRKIRRLAASGGAITSLRNQIRAREQARAAWNAAGKRMRAAADAQIDQEGDRLGDAPAGTARAHPVGTSRSRRLHRQGR